MRKWIIILILVAAAGISGAWYLVKRDGSAPEYQTVSITRGDLVQVVTATGQLNPVKNVQVGSQISGRIKAIYVDFNSEVQSNQVIAQIDPSTYQVAVLRAEAQLSNSVANRALARVQTRRAESLFENNLIPAADYDTAIAQLQQAEAQVKSDEASLQSATVDLSRCTIQAPVDGVVISRNVDVGQTVAASFNTPTLFLIANDLTKMQIDALVSEADIGGVQVGQDVNFSVDAYPYRTFEGQVKQIRYGALTNQNVVNYDAVIEVQNEDLKLLPGMTANVSIIVAQRENVLKVPNAALRFRPPEPVETTAPVTNIPSQLAAAGPRPPAMPGQNRERGGGPPSSNPRRFAGRQPPEHSGARTVYILASTDHPGTPALKPIRIQTGINDGVSTEVSEGLKEGDQVVTGMVLQESESMAQRPSNPFGGGRRRF